MESAKPGGYVGHGTGTGFGAGPNDPFSTPFPGLQHGANGQGMNGGDWSNLLSAGSQQQHLSQAVGERHWPSSSSGWPASQGGLVNVSGAATNGGPSALPARLGTPDRHLPNPSALGRAQAGLSTGFGAPINAGDFNRVGSGFTMPPQRPGSAQLQQPMLSAGQPHWTSSTGKQTPNGFPGQRLAPVSSGGQLVQNGRMFTDANVTVGQIPLGLNGLPRGRPQVSGPYPTGLGQSYTGSNSGRPGSDGSVHSATSYGNRVPPPSLNGMHNGGPNLMGGGMPPVIRPGAADIEVLQQLHGLTLNGGAGTGIPSARPANRFGGAPFSLQHSQQSRGDVLAALLAQARQQQQIAGMTGKALAQQQQQQQQAALAQQQALLAARQQHAARTNDALLARGINGNVGANVNLQLAAAQQAAAARAANAHRVQQQQQPSFANSGYNGLNGLTGATGLNLHGTGANHAALIAEASSVAAARQQQQQAAAISGLVSGLGAGNTYQPAVSLPIRPRAPPAPRPAGRPGGFPGVDGASLAQDTNARVVLMELGQTLAQLGITVEGAVNAGLLGGLSAADVKVLSDAHSTESRRLALNVHMERIAGPTQQQQQVQAQQQSQLQQLQQQAAQQAQQHLVSQPPPPPPIQSLGTNLGQLLLPSQQQQQSASQGMQALQAQANRPQALFPQAFQLGSSLTDTPRPSAPGSVDGNGNGGQYSISSAASLSNSPFSFFGAQAAASLPTGDVHAALALQGAVGDGAEQDGDAVMPSQVLDNMAELLGETRVPLPSALGGAPGALLPAFAPRDVPQDTSSGNGATNHVHASFDASAYAFFGSVEASEDDALPLENDDDELPALDVEDESEPSTAALSAADEACPAPARPNAMLDNARIIASA